MLAAASVVTLAACGGGGSPATAPTPVAHSASAAPASSAGPSSSRTASASASFHGIVLASQDPTGVHLFAIDPTSGRVTGERTFAFDSNTFTPALNSSDPGWIERESFNSDFTELAATGPQQADGSQNAGYIDTSGQFHALTASPSGYGTTLQYDAIGFNPATGRLWYQTPQGSGSDTGMLGSVDPQAGPGTMRTERGSPSANGMVGGYNNRLFFAPDGYGPIDIAAFSIGGAIFLPGGLEADRQAVGPEGYVVGREGNVDDNMMPSRPLPTDVMGWPQLPVSATSFLMLGAKWPADENGKTQIYDVIIHADSCSAIPLLPLSNRQVQETAVNPAKTEVAFISVNGSITSLFTTSLSGHQDQPTKLIDLSSNELGSAYWLLAWNS